jgi:carbon monoxide dehydrogenase subunit G
MNIRYVIIEWRRLQVSTVKLKSEVIIEADRATVWRLFGDPDNLASWQPSLESVRLVSGTRGHPDAVSELIYDENGRKVVLTVGGTYASGTGSAVVLHRFEDAGDKRTRWIGHWNHSFNGAMRFVALLFRRSMQKRVEADMQRFRDFVHARTGND